MTTDIDRHREIMIVTHLTGSLSLTRHDLNFDLSLTWNYRIVTMQVTLTVSRMSFLGLFCTFVSPARVLSRGQRNVLEQCKVDI